MDALDDTDTGSDKFTLGEPAEDAYEALSGYRQQVIDLGRLMAELTIPSVFPPEGYRAGDDLPGNNQSVNAHAVNTLASELMFMAFPPGQPIMKLEPIETKMQAQIDKDPDLYSRTQLALSRLEIAHRKRFLLTPMATAYVGYMKLLIVAGNALWKHIKLNSPTYHRPDCYVVSRSRDGHPLVTIHKERVRVATLEQDIQDIIYAESPELSDSKTKEWEREADIYSVCKFVADGEDGYWLYWQEYKGRYIEDSGVETDYMDCPMWPGWLIPVYGDNWGRSYCEEYRGDLFTLEAHGSSLNDISALAGWALVFAKPGARTSLRQVQKARNLDILSGSAEDLSVFRSEKGGDANIVSANFEQAARRIGAAFLVQSAVMRQGERVTKEEVMRVGRQLDRAMGGLYTEIAQGHQRRIIHRAVRLHEESNKDLPVIPEGVVEIGVITGIDAMGNANEGTELIEFGTTLNTVYGPGSAGKITRMSDFATRLAATKGIKPDGLVVPQKDLEASMEQDRMQAMQASMMEKAAGPAAGALAGALSDQSAQPQPAQEG